MLGKTHYRQAPSLASSFCRGRVFRPLDTALARCQVVRYLLSCRVLSSPFIPYYMPVCPGDLTLRLWLSYRGRVIRGEDVAFLRQFIAEYPTLTRYALSCAICEAWQWKQANGDLRDIVCRGLLLELEREGKIRLPPARRMIRNSLTARTNPEPVVPANRPVRRLRSDLTPLKFEQIRRPPQEGLLNSLPEQYHYLRYEQPVGEHFKYLVSAHGEVITWAATGEASSPHTATYQQTAHKDREQGRCLLDVGYEPVDCIKKPQLFAAD